MDKSSIERLIEPTLRLHALELSDIKWVQEGSMRILQIAIMHEDGTMDLDTCAMISQEISPLLDASPLGSDAYVLEVCSPGAERLLKDDRDIQRSIGSEVKISFHHPIDKSLEWTGTLLSYDGVSGELMVRIKAARKKIRFEKENMAKIRLAVRL